MSDRGPSKEAQIIRPATQGYGRRFICDTLGVGEHRVSNTLKAFHDEGIIPTPLARGRPPKLTKAILDFIDIRTLQDAHLPSAQLSREIRSKYGVTVSSSSVEFKRKLLGFHFQPPRHKQDLKPHHIANRVEFSRKMLDNRDWLPLIHFSDESRFVLGDDKRWVWYRRGEGNESAMHTTEKFPPSVMIFAVIGIRYKSKLLFVEGTINTERYIQNLNELGFIDDLDQMHGVFGWIFQQDGAPCHTSQEAIDWMEECLDLISDWPANSPDLNPIELLWAILKHAVAALNPKTIEELREVLLQAWNTISQFTIDLLCRSFEKRLELCLQVEGQSISKMLAQCGETVAAKEWRSRIQVPERWLPEEDEQLYRLYHQFGTKWEKIARFLPNHTPNGLRNRWYAVLSKREKALLDDTDLMLDIRDRMRTGKPIPELSR